MVKIDTKFKTEIGAVTDDLAAVTISINNAVVIHEVDIPVPPRPYPAGWMGQVGALAMADMLINGPSVASKGASNEDPSDEGGVSGADAGRSGSSAGGEDTSADAGVPDSAGTEDGPAESGASEAGTEAGGDAESGASDNDSGDAEDELSDDDGDIRADPPVKKAPPKAKKKPAKKTTEG